MTRAVSDAVSVPVIASGGVGTLDHLADGAFLGSGSTNSPWKNPGYGVFVMARLPEREALFKWGRPYRPG
jgi:cyclase